MNIKPKSILAFDLDGTLTPRNQFGIHPQGLGQLLTHITELNHYVIPVTGKPASYAAQIFTTNKLPDRGIVAENAGVYRKPNSNQIEVFGPSLAQLRELRDQLGIGMDKVNVTNIIFGDTAYEVVIDPGDVSILTIFTDPSFVSHRWQFRKSIDADTVVEKIQEIITARQWELNLVVLPPFPDGAVQVIRKDPTTGHPIDKASLVFALTAIHGQLEGIPIAMFGDGHNDIPAMKSSGVIPLTFSNAHQAVREFVPTKNGYISQYEAPKGLGVADGLLWLCNHDFFGRDTNTIRELILSAFPSLK